MTDIHHFKRRAHAIRRLAERYGIFISVAEYEAFAQTAQHAPQLPGTNLVKTTIQGREVYCSIQRGEVSTFVTKGQAEWLVHEVKRSRQIGGDRLTSLGDLF